MTLDRGGGLRQFRVRFRFCAVAPRILRFHRMATKANRRRAQLGRRCVLEG